MKLEFLHPKYWPLWTMIVVARLFVLLPYKTQMQCGKFIGRFSMRFAKKRCHIAACNIKLCFPELSPSQQQALLIKSFESIGMSLIETLIAWWMPNKLFSKISCTYKGKENFFRAIQEGKGIILCSGHFTCLEIIGRFCCQHYNFYSIYQKHRNPVFNHIMYERRSRYVHKLISRTNIKGMVRNLRNKGLLWYAPDQDLGAKRSVFANFFGVPTATLKATSWLALKTDAKVVPFFFRRLPNYKGYEVEALPHFTDFPSEDNIKDASAYNTVLEKYIRTCPEQYLWQHRRFKTRPEGCGDIYKK
ncbi:MAG: LPS biosynthesis protein [Legionellales bacterium]|nr:MAG: LPS biosynthesis protein [Legionellales bacterium]